MIKLRKHFSKKNFAEQVCEYLNSEGVKSLPGLAVFLGVDRSTLDKLSQQKSCCETYALAKTFIEKDIIENGLKGKYNATMSSFLLKSVFGYRDKGEEEQRGAVKIEVADELSEFSK